MKIASTPIGAAAVLTAIECVGDTAAKLNYPAVTYLTYNALAYVLNDALPTMSMALTNSYWNAMTKGIQNAHNMPVLVSKDQESGANFTEVGGQLNEMAFGKWMSFLTSIACAIYGISPEEVSMESFSAGKSALSGSDTEEKIVSSTDKGLRPLMSFYEATFSDFIIQEFSPEYCFRFGGLDAEDMEKRFEVRKLAATWNEMRAEEGLEPIKGKAGDAPINPTLQGVWMQIEGIGPEQQDFGEEGDGGDQPAPNGAPPEQGEEDDFGDPGDGEPEPTEDVMKSFGFPVFKVTL